MSNVSFSRPSVFSGTDSIEVRYPFYILDCGRENFLKLSASGSLLIEYERDTVKYDKQGYYDQFVVEMFPYAIDKIKQDPYAEGMQIGFSSQQYRPGNTYNDWDTTQPIEAIEYYELEV